ncbi:MAG TPA: TrmH family RNA methyltransferase [Aquihabitans sp.]|nr:TrmH family RNA methyltransferase [Aquihabitans sp.]
MPIRVLAVALDDERELASLLTVLAADPRAHGIDLVALGPVEPSVRWRAVDAPAIGVAPDGPEVVAVAAATVGAFPRQVLVVAPAGHRALAAAAAGGARAEALAAGELDAEGVLGRLLQAVAADAAASGAVGVGPHPEPWPDDLRLDPELLALGDRRNVVDRFRYWREDAIVDDLDARRHPVHVAVENWRHDLNIGTVVRNANAFNVASVRIVGERRWNRRGAMATDRYLPVEHHPDVADLAAWAAGHRLPVVGVDNVPGARDLDASPLPPACVLLLGQEGPGLSVEAVAACAEVVAIGQHGSTRSLNAGVASGIVLHAWAREHAPAPPTWPGPRSVS